MFDPIYINKLFYMIKRLSILFVSLYFLIPMLKAQEKLPSVIIKSVKKGKELSFSSIATDCKDTILVVSFFATWCIPCAAELDNINEVYQDKQKEKPFKFIAVAIDDSRTSQRVKPFVNGKGWTFDVYLDLNSDLKRAFEVNDIPQIIIIKNNKVVYQHTGYIAGGEDELFDKIKSL